MLQIIKIIKTPTTFVCFFIKYYYSVTRTFITRYKQIQLLIELSLAPFKRLMFFNDHNFSVWFKRRHDQVENWSIKPDFPSKLCFRILCRGRFLRFYERHLSTKVPKCSLSTVNWDITSKDLINHYTGLTPSERSVLGVFIMDRYCSSLD